MADHSDGWENGTLTNLDAVNVDTGIFTGRSPNDKYIVDDASTHDTIWWADGTSTGSDNKAISIDTWNHLQDISVTQLKGKRLFVMDGFCGANPDTRLSVRIVTEVAWMAHFFKNMFIRPTPEELENFTPD